MARFKGFCDDAGHVAIDDRDGWLTHIRAKYLGREFWIVDKPVGKTQGTQSMRYYRGIVVPDIAEACGVIDPDDFQSVHSALAWKFLRLPDGMFGEPRRRSTAKDDLTQEEMTRYIDQVITFAETEIVGCRVRRPNEVDEDDYREWDGE